MPRSRSKSRSSTPRATQTTPGRELPPELAAAYLEACRERDAGNAAAAVPLLQAVLARAPARWDAWTDYGSALADLDRYPEALAAFDRALALRPPQPADVLHNRGTTLLHMNRPRDALADFAAALATTPDSATLQFDAALAYLVAGDLERGLPLYEARLTNPALPVPARLPGVPRWTGTEAVAGRRVLLYAEQGHGDTLQFCRYAPLLAARGAEVVLEVQPPLAGVLRQLPGVAAVVPRQGAAPPADLACPLASLPLAFGTTLATIPGEGPYLAAEAAATAAWRQRFAGQQPVIGLAWAGNPRHRNDARRSLDPALLGPLLAAPGRFVSLQKDVPLAHRRVLEALGDVTDVASDLPDFAATAAAVAAVDLVITVDTAIAHLAGALGKPVWILLPFAPDWRWLLDRDDSPWYPTARLFRQARPGDWAGVIRRVQAALAARG